MLNSLLDNRQLLAYVPFLAAWTGQRHEDRPLLTRSIENLLTAAVAAGVVMYSNVQVGAAQLGNITTALTEIRAETRQEIALLHADITALQIQLAQHNAHDIYQPPKRGAP